MPGVTGTSVCFPCAPTTVTKLAPEAVVTIAATGTVSTGPSVCPVSTVTRTFSPFSAAGSGLDGRTVSGTNGVPPELLEELEELDEFEEFDEPDEFDELEEFDDPDEPDELAELDPPMLTIVPVGAVVTGVPRFSTVPVARVPVTSS